MLTAPGDVDARPPRLGETDNGFLGDAHHDPAAVRSYICGDFLRSSRPRADPPWFLHDHLEISWGEKSPDRGVRPVSTKKSVTIASTSSAASALGDVEARCPSVRRPIGCTCGARVRCRSAGRCRRGRGPTARLVVSTRRIGRRTLRLWRRAMPSGRGPTGGPSRSRVQSYPRSRRPPLADARVEVVAVAFDAQ
jgi:hypothetical protein